MPFLCRPNWVFAGLRLWIGVAAGVLLVAAVCAAAEKKGSAQSDRMTSSQAELMDPREILGPLPIRNLQPIHLLFFEFTPERAYALRKGRLQVRLDVTETNTLLDDTGKEPFFKADAEMTRVTGRFKYGLTRRLTLGVNVPIVYIHGGFLDGFIEAVERSIDRLRGDREAETANQVDIRLIDGGTTEIDVREDTFGVGDVSLEGLFQVFQETFWIPAVSLRLAVKFPTGEFSDLHGSGEFDGAAGVAIQKIWGRWSVSVGGGVTLPGNPFQTPRLKPDPILYGHFSLERLLSAEWSIGGQLKIVGGLMDLDAEESADPNIVLRVRPLTDRSYEINLGAKWAFRQGWLAQFGIVQNFKNSAAVDADFSLYFSLGSQFDLR